MDDDQWEAYLRSKASCAADCAVHDFDVCTCIFDKKVEQPVRQPQVQVDVLPAYTSCYEVTLTSTKDDPYELRQWIQKIANSAMYAVVDMPYCIELTEKGIPHIHAILYSNKKYCDGTKVKRMKFPYRYEFKRVRDIEKYKNYIYKEKDNPVIIEYCFRKGIPQFSNAIQKDYEAVAPEEDAPILQT